MKISTFIAVVSLVTLCTACNDSRHQIEAFVVIGNGNGVPLSGREVLSLDNKFDIELSKIYSDHKNSETDLTANAINNNPTLKSEIQVITEEAEKLETNKKEILININEIKKSPDSHFSEDIEKLLKPLNKSLKNKNNELSSLKKTHSSIMKITTPMNKQIKKYKDTIQDNYNRIGKISEKISSLAKQHIIKNNLKYELPDKNIEIKHAMSFQIGEDYRITHQSTENKYAEYITIEIPHSVGKKISSKISSDLYEAGDLINSNSDLKEKYRDIENNYGPALIPVKNKNITYFEGIKPGKIEEKIVQKITHTEKTISDLELEINKINSPGYTSTIKEKEILSLERSAAKLQEEISSLANKIKRETSSYINADKYILDLKSSQKIENLIIDHTLEINHTDLNGTTSISPNASYIYLVASRTNGEEYSWLIKSDDSKGKQILANHNISKHGKNIGIWVFENVLSAQ